MQKEIIVTGKRISYRITGAGNKIMLIHGFGETGAVWYNQVTALNPHVQCVVPDLPGSGDSEALDDMSIEGMAAAIRAIAEAEIMSPFLLIGHSMGGYITLAFAEKYPGQLAGFGLFHSTAYPDTEEKKATRRKGIQFIHEHGATAFLQTTSPNLFSPITKSQNPSLVSAFIAGLNNFSEKNLVSYYQAMINRPDRTLVLKNSAVPVLFIFGATDTAVPIQDGLRQCYLPQKSYIHILKESGHMGMLEEAATSNKVLEKYIEDAGFF